MSKQERLLSGDASYYELSKPFESSDVANEAMRGFFKELHALRVKYRMADVLTVIRVNIQGDDGSEYPGCVMAPMGNEELVEGMAAYAYGRAVSERQQRVGKLMSFLQEPTVNK